MTRTFRSLVASVALACLPAAIGCRSEAAPPPERPPTPVRAVSVAAATRPSDARYSASIVPLEQVTLSFRSAGYVETLLQVEDGARGSRTVQAGDRVAKDAVLARLREADHRAALQQADAAVAEAEAGRAQARVVLQRTERLYAVNSVTQPELEAARLADQAGEARVKAAQAARDLVRIGLGDTALHAPFDGVVLERRIERGSLVSPGVPAFAIADVRAVKAVFGVPDSALASVRRGATLTLTADGIGTRAFTGRISSIAPVANPQSRVFDVEVTVANGDGALRPGMIATAHLGGAAPAAAAAAVPSVPLASIVKDDASPTGYVVFVVETRGAEQVARARPVKLGDVAGNAIEVIDGVSAGDRVVVTGASRLTRDEKIRVVP